MYGIMIGSIVDDSTLQPIDSAMVICQSLSTNFQKNVFSGRKGNFEIDALPFGWYRLKVLHEGYNNYVLDSIHIRAERFDFNIGDVKLKTKSTALDEVIVYAEKPLIENKDDKVIFNVGESVLANSSSTADLIKNLPLISNDPNGKLLLKGKEPKILIDDKPTELTAQQLTDLLESLPGSSIEKIELMTNPPPQFAGEPGGVINIVTKKSKIGFTGRINFSVGTRGDANFSTFVSYRSKKTSYTLNVGVARNRLIGENSSIRTNYYRDSSNQLQIQNTFINTNLRPNWRLQVDHEFNKKSNLNLVYQANINLFDNSSNTVYTNYNRDAIAYKQSKRDLENTGFGLHHQFNFSYTFKPNQTAEQLKIIGNYNVGNQDNERNFFQQFFAGANVMAYDDSSQQQATLNSNYQYSLRINYDKPLGKKFQLSSGASYSVQQYNNALNTFFQRKSDGVFDLNDLLSNEYIFKLDVAIVRAAITYRVPKKWRFTIGAQAEQTLNAFDFIRGNASDVKTNYFNILPNLTIRKELSERANIALVYRATIRRPGVGELNPNIDYNDPYNLRFGNPYLDPSLSDNWDLNWSYNKGKYNFNASVGYNKVKDIFNTIRTLITQGKTQVTWQNIANRTEYEASVWGGISINKKWRVNSSMGYSFNKYNEQEKQLYKYRDGSNFYTTLNSTFTPNTLTNIELNVRYNSFADPQGRSRSNVSMSFGFLKRFLQRRLSVGINIIDPIFRQQFTSFTFGNNFQLESRNASNTRNYKISVSYQLNKVVQANRISKVVPKTK